MPAAPVTTPVTTPVVTPGIEPAPYRETWTDPDEICTQQSGEVASPDVAP